MKDFVLVACFERNQELLSDYPGLVFAEMTLGILVRTHKSVEVAARKVRKHNDELLLAADELLDWHDVVTVAQFQHKRNLLPDVYAQIFLDNFGLLHALEAVDLLRVDVSGYHSHSNHPRADDASDFIRTNLSVNFCLRHCFNLRPVPFCFHLCLLRLAPSLVEWSQAARGALLIEGVLDTLSLQVDGGKTALLGGGRHLIDRETRI